VFEHTVVDKNNFNATQEYFILALSNFKVFVLKNAKTDSYYSALELVDEQAIKNSDHD
jgi:hypothetical protein